jgi:hypothetical protein
MTMSYSYTISETFTLTDAKRLAGKVIADMHQCRRFYGDPPDDHISEFQEELVVLLAGRYVTSYEFGYKTSDERRVVSWRYHVTPAGDLERGRSGGLIATADVSRARWFNFLTTSTAWADLTPEDRRTVDAKHPISRTVGEPPTDGSGRWVSDRAYASGGVAVQREEFRPW